VLFRSLFCRVIDHHGDLGVCWRVAAELAVRGDRVRLWVDDPAALAWMAPHGCPGVAVARWSEASVFPAPGDAVVEAFGCELPPAFVSAMARAAVPPAWIDLEYLSAESYVERSHGLPSPLLAGPGAGLVRRMCFPGFTARTGGLARERDLDARQQAFDPDRWRAQHGLGLRAGERCVSLFCYDEAPALEALLATLAATPTLLLLAADAASRLARRCLGAGLSRGALRAVTVPWLTQRDYDHLLWACDLNLVRGEDSFVRAQWAGRPFLWQLYPQPEDVRRAKLAAWCERHCADADPALACALRAAFAAWNGFVDPGAALALPSPEPWQAHCAAWRSTLAAGPELVGQLRDLALAAR
jgi:uncharacterized repeat protein (TIGR03837 family)